MLVKGIPVKIMITSEDNSHIRLLRKLADKKYRRQTGLYVIEGERLVSDALRHGADVKGVYVSESSRSDYGFGQAVTVSDGVFGKISDTVNSQGVVAVVAVAEKSLRAPRGNCLIMDGVRDPGNAGTLIRTAAACGFTDVYMCKSVDAYSPKVLRAAMSAHFCVDIFSQNTVEEVFAALGGCKTLCADMSGENIFRLNNLKAPVALIVGGEADGVSDYASSRASVKVCLPMENGFESLNAAVAGSVIMYMIYGANR